MTLKEKYCILTVVVVNLLIGGEKVNIKLLRVAKKLSQTQLAQLLNVNQTAVSQWERGVSRPRAAMLKKLADVLGVTVDHLLSDNGGQKGA